MSIFAIASFIHFLFLHCIGFLCCYLCRGWGLPAGGGGGVLHLLRGETRMLPAVVFPEARVAGWVFLASCSHYFSTKTHNSLPLVGDLLKYF